jgi:hypothetical protein
MKRKSVTRIVPVLALAGLCTAVVPAWAADDQAKPAAGVEQKKEENVLKGKITGKSKKAKTITIQVGKEPDVKTLMVKFDDTTTGMEFSEEGEAAIIRFETRGEDKFAVEVKPKLAELPEGVAEIQPDEVAALLGTAPGSSLLVDSRPANRYADGHIPTAVSIPVPKMKKEGETLLPAAKDIPIVFYCGGVT